MGEGGWVVAKATAGAGGGTTCDTDAGSPLGGMGGCEARRVQFKPALLLLLLAPLSSPSSLSSSTAVWSRLPATAGRRGGKAAARATDSRMSGSGCCEKVV